MIAWRKLSTRTKQLCAAGLAAFCLYAGSFMTVAWIETAALSQPRTADSVYIHPHTIKGGIRFFTDQQETIYSIAKPTMIGTLILTAIFAWLMRRRPDYSD
jgi:hypothetical protein